jgi:hypothetical protein
MRQKIFENNYLKNELLNPEYRGLAGWKCIISSKVTGDHQESLVSLDIIGTSKFCTIKGDANHYEIGENLSPTLKIPEFTVEDIPDDELVWQCEGEHTWVLKKKSEADNHQEFRNEGSLIYNEDVEIMIIVPYLIAKDEEAAEKLKGWSE